MLLFSFLLTFRLDLHQTRNATSELEEFEQFVLKFLSPDLAPREQ